MTQQISIYLLIKKYQHKYNMIRVIGTRVFCEKYFKKQKNIIKEH